MPPNVATFIVSSQADSISTLAVDLIQFLSSLDANSTALNKAKVLLSFLWAAATDDQFPTISHSPIATAPPHLQSWCRATAAANLSVIHGATIHSNPVSDSTMLQLTTNLGDISSKLEKNNLDSTTRHDQKEKEKSRFNQLLPAQQAWYGCLKAPDNNAVFRLHTIIKLRSAPQDQNSSASRKSCALRTTKAAHLHPPH